jgi:hypothetical protein
MKGRKPYSRAKARPDRMYMLWSSSPRLTNRAAIAMAAKTKITLLVFGPQFLDLGTEAHEGVSSRAGETPLDDHSPALEDWTEVVLDLTYGGAVEGSLQAGFVNISASDLAKGLGIQQSSAPGFTSQVHQDRLSRAGWDRKYPIFRVSP